MSSLRSEVRGQLLRRPRFSTATVLFVGVVMALAPACGGGKAGPAGSHSASSLLSAPTGLTASAESGGAVQLSWKAPAGVAGITGYTIYRDGVQLKFVSPSLTTYLDTSVVPEHSYSYAVEASGASVKSPKTPPVMATTPAPPSLSEARVEGRFLINGQVTRTNFTNYHPGSSYGATWYFTPVCDTGACNVKTGADGQKEAVLKRSRARYQGKVVVPKAGQCGSVKLDQTEAIDFRVTDAQFHAGVWLATKIQGTVRVDAAAGSGCSAGYLDATFKAS